MTDRGNSGVFIGSAIMVYLTIIPRAHEGERNNCFSKIQLVGHKNVETKHLSLVKARL